MTTIDIRVRLRELLVRDHALEPAALTADASLESLGIDSLGLMELMFNVEEELGIDVPSEPPPLVTLGEVADWIDRLAAEQGARPAADPSVPASDTARA